MKNSCRSIFEGYSEASYGSGSVKLKEFLVKRGISLGELGTKADIDPNTLKRYCADTIANVSLDILAKICYCLECELSDVLIYDQNADKRKWNKKND